MRFNRDTLYDWAQSRWFLECAEDDLLTRAINETTREDALLGLLFMKKDELVQDVMVKFACSNHEAVEY